MSRLSQRLVKKGFQPRHAAEVGVYSVASSNVADYVQAGVRCTLVEPLPSSVARLREEWGELPNVSLHAVAAADQPGMVVLTDHAGSSYVSTLPTSPAHGRTAQGSHIVPALTFDSLDDGTIDLLSTDAEGSEWFVIKHMRSRPTVLSVETHGRRYRNPFLREIEDWTLRNGYQVWYRDKSDTVYVRDIAVTPSERAGRMAFDLWLAARRVRYA